MAVVEFSRTVLGLAGANSLEFDERTPHPVVSLMESQVQVKDKGGTMRLGSSPAPSRASSTARTWCRSATATASR
jgi:CTP synthase